LAPNAGTRVLAPPPIPPRPDRRATGVAAAFAGVIVGVVLLVGIVSRARRAR